ncbi:DUF2273 domain-containing protein [Listeria sp. PSOL-1]|uniref:DUF2273 domain-containing protein n=1 Tax=Listeria sp. PSOL-1 TaxID=1844999 RepID=UPI0013D4040E|nr:DUF2273 domain-containing protein [Listeria sp. PSOL-1]
MDLLEFLKPYRGRIFWTLLGFIIAVLWITIGFGYTLLILLLIAIGFVIGKWRDGALDLQKWFQFISK